MPARATLLCLLFLACCAADDRPLLVSTQGLPAGAAALRVDAQLGAAAATDVKEVHYGLDLFGLSLPRGARGPLRLQVDALDAGRCVLGRGFADVDVGAGAPGEVTVPLRALAAPLCRCSATGWCWEAPLPQGNHLRAVFGLTATDAWAVGDYGTIFRWDGAKWRSVASGSIAHLYGVWASADDDVWAVGERGTVLHWNGVSWIAVNSRMTVTADLYGVWGFAGGEVWAIGNDGTVLRANGAGALFEESIGTKLRLRAIWGSAPDNLWVAGDDGLLRRRTLTGWVTPPGATTERALHGVYGYRAREVFAVGDQGTILHVVDGQVRIESTAPGVDLGAVWVPPPTADPPPDLAEDVWAAGALRGQARGALLHRERDAWTQQPIANQAAANVLTGLSGAGPEDLWLAGLYGTLLRWRADEEVVLGAQGTTRVLRGLWSSGPEDMWAVGSHEGLPVPSGTLLHYDGAGWRPEPAIEGRGGGLLAVSGRARDDVWVTGRGGAVLHYDGAAWRTEDVSALTRADLPGVWAGGGEVWAVGPGGLALRRAGGRWERLTIDARYDLSAVWGVAGEGGPEVWVGGGDVTGRGVLLRGGGGALAQVPAGAFAKVLFIAGSGPRDVWATIDKGPMLHWNGARFDAVDTGTTRSLTGLWFFGPSDGWAVGEEGRIFFWNGATWARLISGTNNDLDAVFGTGLRNLWAVGHGGTIMRQRL